MWGGTVPPTPHCQQCGATAKPDYGRIIPMKPRPPEPREMRMLDLQLEANNRDVHHKRVNMTLRPEAHDLGRELARRSNRNLSSLVEILIEREAQRVLGTPIA